MEGRELPAARQLWGMITAYWLTQSIYVAAKLGIADMLTAGPMTSNDLAALAKVNSNRLHRLMRFLASRGVFSQTADLRFGLTRLSECLRTDVRTSIRAVAIMHGEEQYEAWRNLLHAVRTGESAFAHTFGLDFFQYLGCHPESAGTFNDAMTASLWRSATLATTYDFSGVASLVDIGGGQGALIASILAQHPGIHGILFDLPDVLRDAQKNLKALGVADRCAIVAGNFFDSVPAGGDVYLLSQIIHDWDDDRSLIILRNCRAAMTLQSRLLLIERVVPEDDQPSEAKGLDLHMMVLLAGQERTRPEYRLLLDSAGFRLLNIFELPSEVSIIEAAPA